MSNQRTITRDRRGAIDPSRNGRAGSVAIVIPLVVLAIAVLGITIFCRRLLQDATEVGATGPADLPIYVAAGCFLLSAGAVVVIQSSRVAERVAGPEHRLIQGLRRLRSGDLSFRLNLRKGDLLTGLAHECNELIEWLNQNPPVGARTGSDMLEVAEVKSEDSALAEILP